MGPGGQWERRGISRPAKLVQQLKKNRFKATRNFAASPNSPAGRLGYTAFPELVFGTCLHGARVKAYIALHTVALHIQQEMAAAQKTQSHHPLAVVTCAETLKQTICHFPCRAAARSRPSAAIEDVFRQNCSYVRPHGVGGR